MSNALYEQRNRRLLDQVALKETDRIPFVFGTRFRAAKFAGITFEEQMYDADKSAAALERVLRWCKRHVNIMFSLRQWAGQVDDGDPRATGSRPR